MCLPQAQHRHTAHSLNVASNLKHNGNMKHRIYTLTIFTVLLLTFSSSIAYGQTKVRLDDATENELKAASNC